MEKFNRAERRAQIVRLKKKRKTYWGYGRPSSREERMSPRQLGVVSQTPHPCSCLMCCNQRKIEGRSPQERGMFQGLLQEG